MLIACKYPFYEVIEIKESTYLDIKEKLEISGEAWKRIMTDYDTNKEVIVFGSTAFRIENEQ